MHSKGMLQFMYIFSLSSSSPETRCPVCELLKPVDEDEDASRNERLRELFNDLTSKVESEVSCTFALQPSWIFCSALILSTAAAPDEAPNRRHSSSEVLPDSFGVLYVGTT